MAKNTTRKIGDEQLVYGMPKRMSATATGEDLGDPPYRPEQQEQDKSEKVVFWSVHPHPGACEKCRKMEGIKYAEKPERPHPNCKCEIKRHEANRQKRYLSGFIEGFEGNAVHLFEGYGHIRVRIKHITGAVGSGVLVWTNRAGVDHSQTLGTSIHFDFYAANEGIGLWNVQIVQNGAANTIVSYVIEYEK